MKHVSTSMVAIFSDKLIIITVVGCILITKHGDNIVETSFIIKNVIFKECLFYSFLYCCICVQGGSKLHGNTSVDNSMGENLKNSS